MIRHLGLLALLLGATTALAPLPARAQAEDRATQQLIERLCPPGVACRGIRPPAGEPPPAAAPEATAPQAAAPPALAPQDGAPPSVVPEPPAAMAGPVPAPPGAKTGGMAPPPREASIAVPPPPSPPRDTTAPEGAPAVSITITFASGSDKLTPQAEAALAPLGRALASPVLAPYRFRIEGHTDAVGSDVSNLVLSQRRAASVRAYLVSRFGIAPQRLEAVGFGESQLLVPTPDNFPEPRNRRVQVVNLVN